MKKINILIFVLLFLLCGCSNVSNQEQPLVEEDIIEEPQVEQNDEEKKKEVPMTDDGKIIFLPGSNALVIYEISDKTDTKVNTNYNNGCWDYDYEYDNGLYSIEVSASNDNEVSYIRGLAGSDDYDQNYNFLCCCILIGTHDNLEYDYDTVAEWVKDNMGKDAKNKFGDANVSISYNKNSKYYSLEIFTDGNDWWQFQVGLDIQQEILN